MGAARDLIPTPQERIDARHGDLADVVRGFLPDAMTISIVTMNGKPGGQLILHDPSYSKLDVAERLRLCADILEGRIR
jgi:hypothetical protein